jgi:hypothetical protein
MAVAVHAGAGAGGGQPGVRGLGRMVAGVSLIETREGGRQWLDTSVTRGVSSGGPRGIGDPRGRQWRRWHATDLCCVGESDSANVGARGAGERGTCRVKSLNFHRPLHPMEVKVTSIGLTTDRQKLSNFRRLLLKPTEFI